MPLQPAAFHILLALASKNRHGYDIMKQTLVDSDGTVKLGPGTLYGNIKKMLVAGLITEIDERPEPALDDSRRRYYSLTTLGTSSLNAEMTRMSNLVSLGRKRGAFNSKAA
jgi:DNA-binding PadR family transcriptional regulator